MTVASSLIQLGIPGSHSLKDKRQVLKGLKDRIRRRFNVSVAEVDSLDIWDHAVLGVAAVSNDRRHANEVIDKVINYISSCHEVIIQDYSIEII
jgi:hypothetical protein